MMQFIQISSRVKWADALWRKPECKDAAESISKDRNYIDMKQFKRELQQTAKQAI